MSSANEPLLKLGTWRRVDGRSGGSQLRLPAAHLVTHAVVVGMTGSGKTGFVTVLIEEALDAGIPALIVDVKGDLPNLLLSFPDCKPERFNPWVDSGARAKSTTNAEIGLSEQAIAIANERRHAFAEWAIPPSRLREFRDGTAVRVITPGSTAGELLHVLSPLERRSARWETDPESARSALSAAISLVLRLLGRDPDPAKSKEHVLLSLLAERRLMAGECSDLGTLMRDVTEPPITEIGALPLDSFIKRSERANLAAALNTLLASPSFASWRQGSSLDVAEWLAPKEGRTPAVVVSVAHLDDDERALVLGVLLEETLSWVRGLPGSQHLKALLVFDEVYGFLPPHPANPPTKRPLVALMKQARAFGVGVVVATQNPMDLDYRALSNAGLWCIGRLQTDADRARVIDGLAGSQDVNDEDIPNIERVIQRLADRWFVVRNAHARSGPILLKPRQTLSWMRGPMTRQELRLARALTHPQERSNEPAEPSPLATSTPKGSDDACPTPGSKSSSALDTSTSST